MTEKETLAKFKDVLSQTTGYYYTDDRAQYLLARISREAEDITHYFDQLPAKEIEPSIAMLRSLAYDKELTEKLKQKFPPHPVDSGTEPPKFG